MVLHFMVSYCFSYKHQTRQEKLARYKHSSLLRKSVNYVQKKFYNIGSLTTTRTFLSGKGRFRIFCLKSVILSPFQSLPGAPLNLSMCPLINAGGRTEKSCANQVKLCRFVNFHLAPTIFVNRHKKCLIYLNQPGGNVIKLFTTFV
jgi:hypothetical protein